MPQSPRSMRIVTIASAVLTAVVLTAAAADSANQREITLQECVEMALAKNLELRIERYNPELALFNLKSVRAGYEPVFTLSG